MDVVTKGVCVNVAEILIIPIVDKEFVFENEVKFSGVAIGTVVTPDIVIVVVTVTSNGKRICT